MLDAVRGDESDVSDVRVEVAGIKVDGHDGVPAQGRVHVESSVDPAAGRLAAKFLLVHLRVEIKKNKEKINK